MKTRHQLIWMTGLVIALTTPIAAQVRKANEIKYPPLGELKIPQPARVVLDNGLVVMALEDHELPLVQVWVRVKTGSRLEPADKIGLAGLTGSVMRTGGTKSRSGDALDEFLEGKAARIETSIGLDSGGASMNCLKQDFEAVLKVLVEVLRYPVFDEEKLKIAKNQVTASIARQNDNPQRILFREFNDIVYGPESPYARVETYSTVNSITREDLVRWHAAYFHPDRMIVGLVGDFDVTEATALVKRAFGDWPRGPAAATQEASYRSETPTGVYYVDKKDMNQSNIIMGHLGIVRNNPDYYAVEVLNQVLSGSFASRLFSNVRSLKGLAYAVSGGVGSAWDHPGTFNMWLTTKTESTGTAIEALLEEARNLSAKPPSADEVSKAQAGILNSFVFNSDSMAEILGQQLTYEFYGYPLDWLTRYREGIEKVTLEQVRAAAKYVEPGKFAILVVGPSQGMDKPLSTYGKVTNVDITIPEPQAPRAAGTTAEAQQRGKELMSKVLEGLGGPTRIDGIASIQVKVNISASTPQGQFDIKSSILIVFPDRLRQEMTLPFGTVTAVMTPVAAFVKTPQGVQNLPDSERGELQKSLRRSPVTMMKARMDKTFSAAAVGKGEVAGRPIELVRVEIQGDSLTLGVDPDSGRILQMTYRGTNLTRVPGEIIETFSDFREVDGITLPFASSRTFNGEPLMNTTTESVAFNVAVDENAFAKPEK